MIEESNDERVLREGLAAVVSGRPLPIGERTPRLVPLLKGIGRMDAVRSSAGREAKRDVLRAAPPTYALACI